MSLPMPLDPGHAVPGFDPEALGSDVQALKPLWAGVSKLMASRPAEGSGEEDQACQRMMEFLQACLSIMPQDRRVFTEAGVLHALKELALADRADRGIEWAFALRQLERALDRYGVVVDVVTKDLTSQDWVVALSLFHKKVQRDDWLRAPLREVILAQLVLFLAMEALQEDQLDDVKYWASRADVAWRRVIAQLPDLELLLRADLAQVRARTAWQNWSEAEREHEGASWKQLAESP